MRPNLLPREFPTLGNSGRLMPFAPAFDNAAVTVAMSEYKLLTSLNGVACYISSHPVLSLNYAVNGGYGRGFLCWRLW